MAADRVAIALPASLVRAIHAAFTSDPPLPSDLFAPGSDPGDTQAIRKIIGGRRWTAVSRRLARDERSGLAWFTDAARRHYLPLWLLTVCDDGLVMLWTASHLEQTTDNPYLQKAIPLYTAAELQAITAFLRWLIEAQPEVRDLAERALPWWEAAAVRAAPRSG